MTNVKVKQGRIQDFLGGDANTQGREKKSYVEFCKCEEAENFSCLSQQDLTKSLAKTKTRPISWFGRAGNNVIG